MAAICEFRLVTYHQCSHEQYCCYSTRRREYFSRFFVPLFSFSSSLKPLVDTRRRRKRRSLRTWDQVVKRGGSIWAYLWSRFRFCSRRRERWTSSRQRLFSRRGQNRRLINPLSTKWLSRVRLNGYRFLMIASFLDIKRNLLKWNTQLGIRTLPRRCYNIRVPTSINRRLWQSFWWVPYRLSLKWHRKFPRNSYAIESVYRRARNQQRRGKSKSTKTTVLSILASFASLAAVVDDALLNHLHLEILLLLLRY